MKGFALGLILKITIFGTQKAFPGLQARVY